MSMILSHKNVILSGKIIPHSPVRCDYFYYLYRPRLDPSPLESPLRYFPLPLKLPH